MFGGGTGVDYMAAANGANNGWLVVSETHVAKHTHSTPWSWPTIRDQSQHGTHMNMTKQLHGAD